MNGDVGKEELYPTAVFERESSDSGLGRLGEVYGHRMLTKRERPSIHGFYKIGKIIGDGNFAVVRECRHRKTGSDFALKVINKAKVRGKEHMIENEILILRQVKHEHIVELIEEFETPKEILLVMELVPGGDLFDAIVEATRFTEKDASHMIRDLASAVQYLHSLKIVHRDIKPENLLVVNKSNGILSLKLADFGLSIEVKSPMFLVCGTPTYVAPEILDESGYGLKVDIWAVGVITYILLCGFPPFRSQKQDQEELFDKILRCDYEFLKPFWDDVSESARDLICRLLVVDVKKRYCAGDILEHPWIQGHTAKTKNIQRQLSAEIEKNFVHRKKLREVALAIQTVIYLSNIIKRKRSDVRQTRSCLEFTHTSKIEQKQFSPVSEERPIVRKRSATFEESESFDCTDSDEETAPASFPNSPVRRGSLSSRIPRAKSTTPSQHIAEIRKSISVSSKAVDAKSQAHKCKVSRRNSNTVGLPYQNVYSENGSNLSDLKPATVTLRSRPSSAKESTKRLSAPVPDLLHHAHSLPSSPKHGMATGLAPGVRKRVSLAKCISVDERASRRYSAAIPSQNEPNIVASNFARRSSVHDSKRSPYRASYPNRNLASVPMESLTVRPRGQRRGSLSSEDQARPEKRERPSSERLTGHVRRDSLVKKRLPKVSNEEDDKQVQQSIRETKKTVENIARISCITDPYPIETVNETTDEREDADISIVRKTNKTENIKIHIGKAIDKSIEKSTTVSVTIDGNKKSNGSVKKVSQQPDGLGRSLLTKVKQLAEEIETLAMLTTPEGGESPDTESKQSFPHACSMPVLNRDIDEPFGQHDVSNGQRPLLDQDTFSETEYLSINMRSPRNGDSPSFENQ